MGVPPFARIATSLLGRTTRCRTYSVYRFCDGRTVLVVGEGSVYSARSGVFTRNTDTSPHCDVITPGDVLLAGSSWKRESRDGSSSSGDPGPLGFEVRFGSR